MLTLNYNKVVPIVGQRTREVVAALASSAGQPVARPKLWNWLWPDMTKDSARRALNTEIWRLRSAVTNVGGDADALIHSSAHDIMLRIDCGFQVDVHDFETALNETTTLDQMIKVCALYRGDFALGITGEWCETIRQNLRHRFLQLLNQIVDKSFEANRLAEAELFAERLTQEDPYDEEATRGLMRTAMARGENSVAAQLYTALDERLRSDLDVRPASKTRALYQLCRTGSEEPQPLGGYRLELAPTSDLALADARRRMLVIADLVTAVRREVRDLARDLDRLDDQAPENHSPNTL